MDIMISSFENVMQLKKEHKIDIRNAAYAYALTQLQEAVFSCGTTQYFHGR
jgi:glutamate dehydrogenase/leucine dehydrogenase